MTPSQFRRIIWNYYRDHKRDLPWRKTRNPYKILVSEVMLQQTQVARVLQKYPQFLKSFPNFQALARAPLSRVLRVWQGMGYNRRALHLKRLAEIVAHEYGGKLPPDPALLRKLPGIGVATAGAIAAFAFNTPVPFIETNIRRAYIHHFFPKRKRVDDKEILTLVEKTLDRKTPRRRQDFGGQARKWYWALMDYGAMLGKLKENPNVRSSRYRRQPPFHGSTRELRGKILKLLIARKRMKKTALAAHLHAPESRVNEALRGLLNDNLIRLRGITVSLTA